MTPFSRRRLCLLLPLALPLALAAPGAQAFDFSMGSASGRTVQGSGRMVDEARTPGSFSRIKLDSSLNLVARPGASAKVNVHADDNIVPLIQTTVEGDTLIVRMKPGASIRMHSDPVVTVEFTQLSAIDMRGSGDLALEAIKGDALQLNMAGSGNARVAKAELAKLSANMAGSGDASFQGRAAELELSIAGSGSVQAQALQAGAVRVSIAGSGDAKVHASDTLKVSVAGSGNVTYMGKPKVDSSVMGSGQVQPAR